MSGNRDIKVGYCDVELTLNKQDKGKYNFKSSLFFFQYSKCYIKITYGWGNNEKSKIEIFVESEPTLKPNFYVSIIAFKGNHSISYPKALVQDPNKCIWSSLMSDIAKQIPGVEKYDINFKFVFQQESELKNFDYKSTQTSYVNVVGEDHSLEKLSEDYERLLDGDTMCDMELKSGEIVTKVHKVVMSARSKFIVEKLPSATGGRLVLHDMDPAAFLAIKRYMYTGKSPVLSFQLAKNIYESGEICNTGCLKKICVDFLVQNLTSENALDCLAIADGEFEKEVIDFIMENITPSIDMRWETLFDQHKDLAIGVLYKLHNSRR